MAIINFFSQFSVFQFVIIYLFISILIGIFASMRVKTYNDFVNAGRRLPVTFIMAMVFATWFGSEAVLGMPAEFIKNGFMGIVKDPFGAFFCLFIIGAFLARKWYRLNMITLSNVYRKRFGATAENLASIAIVISYFGWLAAQLTALGLVINVLSFNTISMTNGILLGAGVVLIYTITGGMISIALNDLLQFIIIIVSLIYILFIFADKSGGFVNVISSANKQNMFVFMKDYSGHSFISFFGALFTLMLGSLPQQDLFQRVNSAKSEKTAQMGMLFGAFLYLIFCLVPIFLVFSANIIEPGLIAKWLNTDSQMILPSLILNNLPLVAQVAFFGAIVSAIMSTASGTLIAPAVVITENVIKKILPNLQSISYILTLRLVILLTGISVTIFATHSSSTIYELMGDAYKITLVTSVAPLFAAMYWKRATSMGAICSMLAGFIIWILCENLKVEEPQLYGFFASIIVIIVVSYLTKPKNNEHFYKLMQSKTNTVKYNKNI